MEPAEILGGARNLERFDYVARHNYGFWRISRQSRIQSSPILTTCSAIQITSPES